MSWEDFTTCAGNDGQILADLGEDAVKEMAEFWNSRSDTMKAILTAAARWGGQRLAAMLAAAGIAAAEAVGAVAAGAGLGVLMAVIVDCYDQL
ncbi:MAG TPA: hypothetical protein VNP92_11135 [Actinophytocola sp.]|nr:hypothetical protein [Actinophytocola sp.]